MAHITTPEAENILDKEFPVLDHGFVRLVDYLGGDQRIAQSARVSYGSGTKTVREDKALIDYLLSHQHTSPFEQVIMTFHCKMPIFVARQWIRHRSARVNEISGRYSVMKNEFYMPKEDSIRFQSKDNRQGRSAEAVPAELRKKTLGILLKNQEELYADYQELLDMNIARELARINLPLSLYTEWYWQIDLHNLFHFLQLRMDDHAQYEIREYANMIAQITKIVVPIAYEAFEKHVLNVVQFSGKELEALSDQIQGKPHSLTGINKIDYERKIKRISEIVRRTQ
ncbi:MAG: thymidylate synthase (FAD) [Candidatus Marinimicrobia bacterium CG08_land_8_20_14_0_20_45_22]|nr:MAG: thymidylate synthase (FAD) [Candidatus Marinimicrobia bacterium CG08_land_8_20_14_0_20_45_22]